MENLVKKKSDEVKNEIKSKQKNDIFTLIEENPEKGPITKSKVPEASSTPTTPNPEASSTPTPKPDASSTPTPKPEASSTPTTNPEANSKTTTTTISEKKYVIPESSIKGDKSQLLLLEIEKLPDRTIKPVVDFNDNCLFYPILSKIGQSPDDISYLDQLVDEGTLTKQVFEKLIICPIHRDAFSSTVRLYCPKCNSLNVDKLNLFEHKRCGYIAENTECDFSDPKNSTCPSCKRKIVDFKKEIRIPAMWHQCLDCSEKFDNAIIKLFCRQHEHDFDTNSGQFVTTYSYRLQDYDAPITPDDEKMHEDLEKLLQEFNFSTEFKATVKGKSGNSHKIPIYAKNNSSSEAITIFINRNSEKVSVSDINSILIPILDIGPQNILFLTTSDVDDDVKPIAKQYGIQIISDPDLSKIIQFVDEFVSESYSRFGEK